MHGAIWQLVTYGFLHFEFWHWFGNMLGLWMFGSAFESAWGTRRFIELFSFGIVGAAIVTIAPLTRTFWVIRERGRWALPAESSRYSLHSACCLGTTKS